jgi:hypothetical protein
MQRSGRIRSSISVLVLAIGLLVVVVPTSRAAAQPAASIDSISTRIVSTAGGTRVRIRGHRLGQARAVLFGRVRGTGLRILGPRRVEVTAPQHEAGTVVVRVLTRRGLSPVSVASRIVYAGAPKSTEVVPFSGSAGTRVYVRGMEFVDVTSITFDGIPGAGLRTESTQLVSAIAPALSVALNSIRDVDVVVHGRFGASPSRNFFYGNAQDGPVRGAQVTRAEDHSLTLDWGIDDPATRQVVVRRTIGLDPPATATAGTPVAVLDADVSGLLDRDVEPGTTYSYGIFAIGAARSWVGGIATGATRPPFALPPGWSQPQRVDLSEGVSSIVRCAGDHCESVDGAGQSRTLEGGAWSSAVHVNDARYGFTGLSCPTARWCLAVDWDGLSRTLVDGHWSAPTAVGLSAQDFLGGGLACTSESFCLGVSSTGQSHRWDGSRWHDLGQIEGWHYLASALGSRAECTSETFCMAVDEAGGEFAFDGHRWAAVGSGPGAVADLSCASPTSCRSIDLQSRVRRWDGVVWSTETTLATYPDPVYVFPYPTGIECVTSSRCIATDGELSPEGRLDGNLHVLVDGIWRRAQDGRTFTPLVCGSETFCLTSDDSGPQVLDTTTMQTRPGSTRRRSSGLSSLSCSDVRHCLALSRASAWDTGDQLQWTEHDDQPLSRTTADGGLRPTRVDCSEDGFCMAIGQLQSDHETYPATATYENGAWSEAIVLSRAGPGTLTSVSCSSRTFCIAGTTQAGGQLVTWDGTAWSDPELVAPGDDDPRTRDGFRVVGVSCTTSTFCAAALYAIHGRYNARHYANVVFKAAGSQTWSSREEAVSDQAVDIACTSEKFCAVSNSSGRLSTWDGSTWREGGLGFETTGVERLACASASLCVGISVSYASVWDGATWSFNPLAPGYNPYTESYRHQALSDVTCPDETTCYVSTSRGNVLAYRP